MGQSLIRDGETRSCRKNMSAFENRLLKYYETQPLEFLPKYRDHKTGRYKFLRSPWKKTWLRRLVVEHILWNNETMRRLRAGHRELLERSESQERDRRLTKIEKFWKRVNYRNRILVSYLKKNCGNQSLQRLVKAENIKYTLGTVATPRGMDDLIRWGTPGDADAPPDDPFRQHADEQAARNMGVHRALHHASGSPPPRRPLPPANRKRADSSDSSDISDSSDSSDSSDNSERERSSRHISDSLEHRPPEIADRQTPLLHENALQGHTIRTGFYHDYLTRIKELTPSLGYVEPMHGAPRRPLPPPERKRADSPPPGEGRRANANDAGGRDRPPPVPGDPFLLLNANAQTAHTSQTSQTAQTAQTARNMSAQPA